MKMKVCTLGLILSITSKLNDLSRGSEIKTGLLKEEKTFLK
tara:strand:+ start:882 stop:1004 length:123 start_codon:yes stop_codon:yes gene_type:complete